MPMLDVFNSDIFGVVSLTTAINKLPYVPSKLGASGLFKQNSVPSTTVVIEEQRGKLMIIPTSARGTEPNVIGGKTRKAKSVLIPHIALSGAIKADDVQNIRAFGQETQLETVSNLVNEKLSDLRQAIELTHEWHRIGAIHGVVLDADGSTVIYNWFDEFGITESVLPFDFADTDQNAVKLQCHAIIREIEDALGMTPYKEIRAFCGSTFFDSLVTCPEVKAAYDRYQESMHLRESQARKEFTYAGITWEEYRGAVGNTKFVDDNTCRFYPTGVPDLFTTTFGPADWIETVNTMGKPVYSKQVNMKWDTGVEITAQSNPLVMCTRPAVLIRGYDAEVGSE